jgi:hypothetical protein
MADKVELLQGTLDLNRAARVVDDGPQTRLRVGGAARAGSPSIALMLNQGTL